MVHSKLKTYPIGSKEAMQQEPSLEPPSSATKLPIGWALEFKCQHGHEDCADTPNGECWLDWLREEQFQAELEDAINEQMYEHNFK